RGAPPVTDAALARRWERITAEEYRRLRIDAERNRPTLLRPYGATDRAEFFAVATECFFLRPRRLRDEHPHLYEVFADWLRQDPAERWHNPPDGAEDSARAEQEYQRHVAAECGAAIRLRPDYVNAWLGRAAARWQLGELEDAAADLSEALRLAPN